MADEGQKSRSSLTEPEPETERNAIEKKAPVMEKPSAQTVPPENLAQARTKAEIVEKVDPNTLPPTYSMVSYCPFVGKCCFLPMNLNLVSLGLGTSCNDHCTTMLTKTKAIWDDTLRVNVDCDINPNLMQQQVKVLSMQPKQAAITMSAPPPTKPKTPPPPAAPLQPMKSAAPVPVQKQKSQPTQHSCQQAQVQVVICTNTKNSQGIDQKNCETVPIPMPIIPIQSRNGQMNISQEPKRYPERQRDASMIFSNQEIVTDLNIDLLRKDSEMSYIDTNEVKPGISGMKNFVEVRNKNLADGKDTLDFVDYFAKKDGCKYIGMLEQIFIEYFEKTKTDILFGENDIPNIRSRAEKSRDEITYIFKIIQVDEEKQLQDYDFPSALEKDCKTFEIDYLPKVMLIGKLHNYGVKMILYWIRLLESKKKPVLPERVYDVATELMADIMVICYGIFTKIADFLVVLAEHPTEKQLQMYSLEYFIRAFRNLVDCICDEIGAIGESAGQIMIRIPNITRQKVVDTMTMLYKQVNFAHLSISRAMEAIAPVLHLYHIRYSIMGPQGYKPSEKPAKVKGNDSKTKHHHKKHKKKEK